MKGRVELMVHELMMEQLSSQSLALAVALALAAHVEEARIRRRNCFSTLLPRSTITHGNTTRNHFWNRNRT